jgi:hypothetical protein
MAAALALITAAAQDMAEAKAAAAVAVTVACIAHGIPTALPLLLLLTMFMPWLRWRRLIHVYQRFLHHLEHAGLHRFVVRCARRRRRREQRPCLSALCGDRRRSEQCDDVFKRARAPQCAGVPLGRRCLATGEYLRQRQRLRERLTD